MRKRKSPNRRRQDIIAFTKEAANPWHSEFETRLYGASFDPFLHAHFDLWLGKLARNHSRKPFDKRGTANSLAKKNSRNSTSYPNVAASLERSRKEERTSLTTGLLLEISVIGVSR
jgi:hypothetical protein